MLAGLPIVAFFSADYLLAPPAPDTSISDVNTTAGNGAARLVAESTTPAAPAQPPTVAPTTTAIRRLASESVSSLNPPKNGLALSIQQELKRVGCYAGDVDGNWSDRTRLAMQAFNTSVHVNLPTGQPDYILLTLLQGHGARACARPCEGDAATAKSCTNPLVEARAKPAPAAPRNKAPAAEAHGTWSSTVVLAAPGRVTAEALAPGATTPAKAGLTSAPRPALVDVRPAPIDRPVGEAGLRDTPVGPSAPRAGRFDAALEGRMAVGVLPPETADETLAPPAIAKAPRTEVRREPPTRVRATSSGGAARLRNMFSDISRNSP